MNGRETTAADVLGGSALWAVECGDALAVLRTLPAGCVHCCVTSPPYFALRSYLPDGHPDKGKEIGLQDTPDAYVARLVEVFAEVRRILRQDGTLWLNLGDGYCNAGTRNNGTGLDGKRRGGVADTDGTWADAKATYRDPRHAFRGQGIKHKDLFGVPWMTAFALRTDGWYLRSVVTWCKTSPMPESVRDRPTSATEMIFLLAKRGSYFYDREAERVPLRAESPLWGEARSNRPGWSGAPGANGETGHSLPSNPAGRNLWNWWGDIRNEPYPDAHFATFPPDLPARCIRLGTSARGCCPACGVPWVRLVERPRRHRTGVVRDSVRDGGLTAEDGLERTGMSHFKYDQWLKENPARTFGWAPSCACPSADPAPCLVLDPFCGSGTAVMVARRLGRRGLGVELNPDYAALARRRIVGDAPLWNGTTVTPPVAAEPGLFDRLEG